MVSPGWLFGLLVAGLAPLRVGVFDVSASGGRGAPLRELPAALATLGYEVRTVSDLTPLDLYPCEVLYLPDVLDLGRVTDTARANLEAFVRAGGSVLQTWHHHLVPAVAVGVERVYGAQAMRVVAPEHPAMAGVPATFAARYQDHIIERVGPQGEVLVVNGAGQPVIVAGRPGAGKVISCGLALAMAGGQQGAAPVGPEVPLLQAMLAWLRPEAPWADRLRAALESPQLLARPASQQAVAGRAARFEVTIGPVTAPTLALEAPGAEVEALPPDGPIQRFTVRVPLPAGDATPRRQAVRATVAGRPLEAEVTIAPVVAQAPPDETRAVWLHVGADRTPEVVYPELQRLGINLAVLRIAGGITAWYGSRVLPVVSDPRAPGGDWLADSVAQAHAHGVRLYGYVNDLNLEGPRSTPETLAALRAAGRLQQDPTGRSLDWFCPSRPENREAIAAPLWEMAERYAVDGLQFDMIRYPSARGCFCPVCRQQFEARTGQPVANWPADVIDGSRHGDWVEFRCGQISALVEYVTAGLRQRNPRLRLSAAVFPDWPACREQVGQDWARWCHEGWLDEVFPMNYTLDPAQYAELAARHRAALPPGFPLIEGLGTNSGVGTMTSPDQLALQIALARQAGAAGWCAFAWRPQQTAALFEPLIAEHSVGGGSRR